MIDPFVLTDGFAIVTVNICCLLFGVADMPQYGDQQPISVSVMFVYSSISCQRIYLLCLRAVHDIHDHFSHYSQVFSFPKAYYQTLFGRTRFVNVSLVSYML